MIPPGGIQPRRVLRATWRQVPVQLTGLDPLVDRPAAHAEASRQHSAFETPRSRECFSNILVSHPCPASPRLTSPASWNAGHRPLTTKVCGVRLHTWDPSGCHQHRQALGAQIPSALPEAEQQPRPFKPVITIVSAGRRPSDPAADGPEVGTPDPGSGLADATSIRRKGAEAVVSVPEGCLTLQIGSSEVVPDPTGAVTSQEVP